MPYIVKPNEFAVKREQVSSVYKKPRSVFWAIETATGKEFNVTESEAASILGWLTDGESGSVNSYDRSLYL